MVTRLGAPPPPAVVVDLCRAPRRLPAAIAPSCSVFCPSGGPLARPAGLHDTLRVICALRWPAPGPYEASGARLKNL